MTGNIKNHRGLFWLVVFGMLLCGFTIGCEQGKFDSRHPNIIIFLADDLGYGDLNNYGGIPETPNIDELAQNGLKFTDFYAPAPNCSPSRAGLLTGRNPNRVGIYSYRRPNMGMHLPEQEVTIAELLKKEGYQTALLGKWHLSDLLPAKNRKVQPTPGDQGFDYWLATENNAQPSHHNPVNFIRNGNPVDTLKGFSSHILAQEANRWLSNRDNEKPFFLYLSFHEVHKKIASPDSLIQKYSGREDPEYHANVENMDEAVGKLIERVREEEELKNTLIIFSSDNGSYRQGSNGDLRGYKGEAFEGGVRVPGIIYWPERIQSHRIVSTPAGLIDILPTISEIMGNTIPGGRKVDGESLMPIISNEEFNRQKPLFWFFYRAYPEMGMRAGKYVLNGFSRDTVSRTHYFSGKAMQFIKKTKLKDFKLYNIEQDPQQKNNLSKEKPVLFDSLKSEAQKLFQEYTGDGPYWENLPKYDPDKAQPKRNFMRNRKARGDM